jgi:nucleoside 2-deoxyribosyltransferase
MNDGARDAKPRVYLAGPDVFLPNATLIAARKKEICDRHGLAGISPLDPVGDVGGDDAVGPAHREWQRIYHRNEAHMRRCDASIANLTPFRGPSADPGTVYEVGFMRALGRPVWGYSTSGRLFHERTSAFLGLNTDELGGDEPLVDADGLQIERFGLVDNLMLDGGIAASGGALLSGECGQAERWTNLTLFEACVALAARALLIQSPRPSPPTGQAPR